MTTAILPLQAASIAQILEAKQQHTDDNGKISYQLLSDFSKCKSSEQVVSFLRKASVTEILILRNLFYTSDDKFAVHSNGADQGNPILSDGQTFDQLLFNEPTLLKRLWDSQQFEEFYASIRTNHQEEAFWNNYLRTSAVATASNPMWDCLCYLYVVSVQSRENAEFRATDLTTFLMGQGTLDPESLCKNIIAAMKQVPPERLRFFYQNHQEQVTRKSLLGHQLKDANFAELFLTHCCSVIPAPLIKHFGKDDIAQPAIQKISTKNYNFKIILSYIPFISWFVFKFLNIPLPPSERFIQLLNTLRTTEVPPTPQKSVKSRRNHAYVQADESINSAPINVEVAPPAVDVVAQQPAAAPTHAETPLDIDAQFNPVSVAAPRGAEQAIADVVAANINEEDAPKEEIAAIAGSAAVQQPACENSFMQAMNEGAIQEDKEVALQQLQLKTLGYIPLLSESLLHGDSASLSLVTSTPTEPLSDKMPKVLATPSGEPCAQPMEELILSPVVVTAVSPITTLPMQNALFLSELNSSPIPKQSTESVAKLQRKNKDLPSYWAALFGPAVCADTQSSLPSQSSESSELQAMKQDGLNEPLSPRTMHRLFQPAPTATNIHSTSVVTQDAVIAPIAKDTGLSKSLDAAAVTPEKPAVNRRLSFN